MGGHTHCCGFGVVVDLKIEISRGMLNSMWVMCTISLTSLGSFSEARLSSLLAAGDVPSTMGLFNCVCSCRFFCVIVHPYPSFKILEALDDPGFSKCRWMYNVKQG
jgi:hypothetical protein